MNDMRTALLAPVATNKEYRLPNIHKAPVITPTPDGQKPVEKFTPSLSNFTPKLDPLSQSNMNEIDDPRDTSIVKHAVFMIVVRRRKMRKHKLRKYRKLNKAATMKVKANRAMAREKRLQDDLFSLIDQAAGFQAEQFVDDYLSRLHYLRELKERVDHEPE